MCKCRNKGCGNIETTNYTQLEIKYNRIQPLIIKVCGNAEKQHVGTSKP